MTICFQPNWFFPNRLIFWCFTLKFSVFCSLCYKKNTLHRHQNWSFSSLSKFKQCKIDLLIPLRYNWTRICSFDSLLLFSSVQFSSVKGKENISIELQKCDCHEKQDCFENRILFFRFLSEIKNVLDTQKAWSSKFFSWSNEMFFKKVRFLYIYLRSLTLFQLPDGYDFSE